MSLGPRWVTSGGRGGVRKFGADGGQVAGDAIGWNSAGSFDGDVFTLFF